MRKNSKSFAAVFEPVVSPWHPALAGNGSSITAVKGGCSIDTSMGMTPLEGLVMGTRCGDLDPAVVLHLQSSRWVHVALHYPH